MELLLFILLLGASCTYQGGIAQATDQEWSYADQYNWKYVPGWRCGGLRQSPININTNDLVINNDLIDIKLWNFDQAYSGNFTNTGHSVQFAPAAGSPTALFQNHFGSYKLQQLHFHWGENNFYGSEHAINSYRYSGEIHFVTKKTTGISTVGDALAVLSVLLTSDDSYPLTGSWKELYNNMPINNQEVKSVQGINLTDFLPPTSVRYFHYEGSLTTPPCSEIVQWFVLQEALYVQSDFLNKARSIYGADGNQLRMNYRYVQDLNGRQVMLPPEYKNPTN